MEPELVYLNGAFIPADEATISINDRGFLFGDSVYEVIAAHDGHLALMDRHMRRLRNSAGAIDLPYDFDLNPLEPVIEEGIRRAPSGDALVYIQITRGVAPRAHLAPVGIKPTVLITFRPRPRVSPEQRQAGVAIMTAREDRWAHCSIKSTNLLPNVLSKTRAVEQGYYDSVFVGSDGTVRETSAANIFLVKGGRLGVPVRNDAVLHGITQEVILECAARIGIPTEERPFTVQELYEADEAFLSSTAIEVLPVSSVDDRSICVGRPGSITQALYDAYRALVSRQDLLREVELREAG